MLREYGPERLDGQGLDRNQYESGDRAILALLAEPPADEQVDIVATFREDAYEVWSGRGMIRFKRFADESGGLHFKVVEQIGENPLERQDPFAVATVEEELRAAEASGNRCDDPNLAFFEPYALTHPFAYERIAQVFDSPRGPDLIVSPKSYAYGSQRGQHGALDVVQSRAPLLFAGRGVRPGSHRLAARHVDIAPTIARLMGFSPVPGLGSDGTEREVYLKRQDGRALAEILADGGAPQPERAYLFLLDGLSHSELVHSLECNPRAIPNLARLAASGAFLSHGSTVNFPSITWPSHSTILTGTWSGHHDVVNPSFHLREHRRTVAVQGIVFETEGWLGEHVETLYEAFKRNFGAHALTASIHEPQGRGADHAAFERRLVGDKARLKEITSALAGDISPRWTAEKDPAMYREEMIDVRGMAQFMNLIEHCADRPPAFVAHEFVVTDAAGHEFGPHHEGLREALFRTDRRIGQVMEILHRRGLLDSTLFVVTSDHGMAAQRVELAANPAVEPSRKGVRGVYLEPMIYLRDLAVDCVRGRDGRTIRVTVRDNDPHPDGSRPPVEGARVAIIGRSGAVIARAGTSGSGTVAFATPANLRDHEIRVEVEHDEFNPRTIRADGTPIRPDLRRMLYGELARG